MGILDKYLTNPEPKKGLTFDQRSEAIEYQAAENSRPDGGGFFGGVADTVRGGASGLARGLSAVGGAAEWYAPEGSPLEMIGNNVKTDMNRTIERNQDLLGESKRSVEARDSSPWNPRGWLYGGFESMGMLAPGIATTVATGNPVIGSAVTMGQFWGDTAQQSYDDTEGSELTEIQRVTHANLRGAAEGGMEAIQQYIPFKVGRFLPKRLTGNIVKTVTGASGKPALAIGKDILKTIAAEVPFEMAQEAAGMTADYAYGQREGMPTFSDVAPVIGPTIIMSAILGSGAAVHNNRQRKLVHDALTNPETPANVRVQAVSLVEGEIRKRDPELADMWAQMAGEQAPYGPVAIPIDDELRNPTSTNERQDVLNPEQNTEPVDDPELNNGQFGDEVPGDFDPVQAGLNAGQFGDVVNPQQGSQVVNPETLERPFYPPSAQPYAEPVYGELVNDIPGDVIELGQGPTQRQAAGLLTMPQSRMLSQTPNIATESGILISATLNEIRNRRQQQSGDQVQQSQNKIAGYTVPEKEETLAAQIDLFRKGQRPAVLFTEGKKPPKRLPKGAKTAELQEGKLMYRDAETLQLAQSGRLGEALGYGISTKPESDTVVTARNKDGVVVQDVVTDGSRSVLDAAQQAAGEGGTVETRPAIEALRERTEKQKANDERLKKERTLINTDNDDVLKAISKLGGLDLAQVKSEWGDTVADSRKDMNKRGVFGKPVIRSKNGLPLDRVVESLKEHGYLDENADINSLLDAVDRSMRGESVTSIQGQNDLTPEEEVQYLAAMENEFELDDVAITNDEIALVGYNDMDAMEREAYESLMAEEDRIDQSESQKNEGMSYEEYWQDFQSEYIAGNESETGQTDTGTEGQRVQGSSENESVDRPETFAESNQTAKQGEDLKLFATPSTFGKKPIPQNADNVNSLDFTLPEEEAGLFDAQKETSSPNVATSVLDEQQDREGDKSIVGVDNTQGQEKALAHTTQSLEVEFNGKRYPVGSIEDAKNKWEQFRDEFAVKTGMGVSGAGDGIPIFKNGKQIARISYNGRVWDNSDKEILLTSTPKASDAIEAPQSQRSESAIKQQSKKTSEKIDDFGEVLIGARKHYADKLTDAEKLDIATEPLSKTWPEPDYQDLLDKGFDPYIVAMVRTMRESVPAKGRQTWKVKQYVRSVKSLRGFAKSLLSGEVSKKDFKNQLNKDKYKNLKSELTATADLYMEVGHKNSLKGISVHVGRYTVYNGEEFDKPKTIWTVQKKAKATAFSNWPKELSTGDTREEAIANFKKKADKILTAEKEKSKGTKFVIWLDSAKKKYFVGKKFSSRRYLELEGFDNVSDARKYLAENSDKLEEKLEKIKNLPNERRAENAPRVGEDHLKGRDVTPEIFTEAFGFRGVQFGNYVEQGKRQNDLNEAYDALMDLAGVIGVPPKALSLNGELGLAFGARGHGGRDAAAAHYEPGTIVINLTKRSGAGSLAHEWWHALDNYFNRQRKASGYMTEGPHQKDRIIDGKHTEDPTRKEVLAAFNEVMAAIKGTELAKRSRKADQAKSKAYYSDPVEMTARSFENFIIEKLNDNNGANDYLANIVSQEYWDAAAALGMEQDGSYPYLTDEEKKTVIPAYQRLFDIIETKETDSGVALYSEAQQPTGNTAKNVESELKSFLGKGFERLGKLGKLKVVQSINSIENDGENGSLFSMRKFKGEIKAAEKNGYQTDRLFYHSTHPGKELPETIKPYSILDPETFFGGIFASEDKSGATGPMTTGNTGVYVAKKILDHDSLQEIDRGDIERAVKGLLYEDATREEEEALVGIFIEDIEFEEAGIDEGRARDLLLYNDDLVELGWYQQKFRGEVAATLGYDAIATYDEHGVSYLLLGGRDVMFIGPEALFSHDGTIVGVYDSGTITLFSNKIAKGDAEYIMRHEGLHMLFHEDKVFQKKRDEILSQFEKLRKTNRKVQAAFDRVPEATREGYETEEALAYFVQDKTNHNHSIFKRLIANVKAWMFRHGIPVGRFTEADFVALATQGVKRFANNPRTDNSDTKTPPLFSKESIVDKVDKKLSDLEDKIHGVDEVYKKNFGYNTTLGAIRKTLKSLRESDFDWRQKLIDRYNPIKTILGEDAYRAHRLLGNHGNILVTWLEHGGIKLDGGAPTITGRDNGFLPWFESLGNDNGRKLLAWIAVNRAEQLEREGRENWLTPEKRKELRDWIGDSRNWKELNKKFQSYNKEILDLAESAGLINREARESWESDIYIPFYRENGEFEDDILHPQKSKRHVSAQIKRLKGGEMKINDLLENTLRNWGHLVQESQRNVARQRAVEAGRKIGIIEEADKRELYLSSRAARKENYVISYTENGQRTFVKVLDIGLFNALSEVNMDYFGGPVMKALGFAKRTLTYGATFGPAFRVANAFRDTLHTAVISESFMPFIDTYKGMIQVMKKSDDYIALMGSGGGFGQGYLDANDPKAMSRQIKKIAKREGEGAVGRIIDTPRKLLELWEHIGHISEMAARTQLYTNAKARGESHEEAAFEARDILDFGLSGDAQIVRAAISTIPFLNARFQGLDRMYRGARSNPKSFAIKGTMITLASLALWSLYKDDDRYKDLEDWEKWQYHHFWIGDYHYRLPKAFEVGAIFSSLPEAIGNIANRNEGFGYLTDFLEHTATQTFSLGFPAVLSPGIEVYSNKSFFTGRSIENLGDQSLPPGLRADPWTSETLRVIGEKYNISPKKMETLIRGHFATLGMFILGGVDIAMEQLSDTEMPARKISQYPLIGRFVRDDVGGRTKYSSRLYETFKEIDELSATVRHYKNSGDIDLARRAVTENRELWGLRKFRSRVQKAVNRIRRMERNVWNDQNMSSDEKRELLDKYAEERNNIYRKAYGNIERKLN